MKQYIGHRSRKQPMKQVSIRFALNFFRMPRVEVNIRSAQECYTRIRLWDREVNALTTETVWTFLIELTNNSRHQAYQVSLEPNKTLPYGAVLEPMFTDNIDPHNRRLLKLSYKQIKQGKAIPQLTANGLPIELSGLRLLFKYHNQNGWPCYTDFILGNRHNHYSRLLRP